MWSRDSPGEACHKIAPGQNAAAYVQSVATVRLLMTISAVLACHVPQCDVLGRFVFEGGQRENVVGVRPRVKQSAGARHGGSGKLGSTLQGRIMTGDNERVGVF